MSLQEHCKGDNNDDVDDDDHEERPNVMVAVVVRRRRWAFIQQARIYGRQQFSGQMGRVYW